MVLGFLFATAAAIGMGGVMAFFRSGDGKALFAMYIAFIFGYWGGDSFQTAIIRGTDTIMTSFIA